jgi:hypothetical protein
MASVSTDLKGSCVLTFYCYIVDLCIHKNLAAEWSDMTTVAIKMRSLREALEIEVLFEAAAEIFVSHIDGMIYSEVSIYDIADFQLEGLRYNISDDHNTLIRFSCRDYRFAGDVSSATLAEFSRPVIYGQS